MRILIVFASAILIALAANSSEVTAHHLKTPEEMCAYTTRRDCLTTTRILYTYCHQPERINEEQCVKWPTLDSETESSEINDPTPTLEPVVQSTSTPTPSEQTSTKIEPASKASSNPSKVSLDPVISKTPQANKEMNMQTAKTGTEKPSPSPTNTSVANATDSVSPMVETNENSKEVEFFSSRMRNGLAIGLLLVLITAVIAETKRPK